MESLESKLDRLSSEQRREVEDFVDFLIRRSGTFSPASPVPPSAPPPLITIAPPLPLQEPTTVLEPIQIGSLIQVRESPDPAPQEDPVTLLMQEIAVDDSMTNDYMDYGKYEELPPSPATEAVKRVKEKISRKKVPDMGNQILDWID